MLIFPKRLWLYQLFLIPMDSSCNFTYPEAQINGSKHFDPYHGHSPAVLSFVDIQSICEEKHARKEKLLAKRGVLAWVYFAYI